MRPRSPHTRGLTHTFTRTLAATAASGTLLTALAAAPATAAPHGGDGPVRSRGVVTAIGGLWLHDRPDRGSRRIGFAQRGQIVSIYCRFPGGPVNGNRIWYLLGDRTWAWGSARYIRVLGLTPRWC
ncbi:SH3 domain-containing protein [Streptomyces sp. NPDC002514]|uniref:SH3 domain-containing protein n=1 Tax=Streptomyces sp. NPDC001270 TaxID=3364554 RepID=UPI0036992063